jgi:hypothetical protein
MQKRGQVTVFIVIGLLFLIVAIFTFWKPSATNQNPLPPDIAPIKSEIQLCLAQTAEEGIQLIASRGGYYQVPEPRGMILEVFQPYYYFEQQAGIPTLQLIEVELANYLEDHFKDCLTSIQAPNYVIQSVTPVTALVQITDPTILVTVNQEITLTHKQIEYSINQFETQRNSRLFEAHIIATDFITSYQNNPGKYCLTCVSRLAEQTELFINTGTITAAEPLLPDTEVPVDTLSVSLQDAEQGFAFSFLIDHRLAEG